jgi:outer membrane protein insertion porin family
MPFQVGEVFDDASSNFIIESLFKTGLFSDISIKKTEEILNITLKENPTIKYFDFELDSGSGLSNWLKGEKMLFTNDILNDEIVNNALSAGNPFTQRQLDEFIFLLESKYSESGYYNSIITPNVSIDSQNRAGIVLSLNQGERVKIDTFTISGAEKIGEEPLLKLFKIGEADMMLVNYFTNKDLFTETEFRQGLDALNNFYFDLGYMDFKIANIDSTLDDSKEKISIDIQVSKVFNIS